MFGSSVVRRLEDIYNAYQPAYGYKLTHLAIPQNTVFRGLPANPRRFQLSMGNSTASTVFMWFDSTVALNVGFGMVSNSNWNYYWSLHGSLVCSEVWFFTAAAAINLQITESLIL